MQRVVSMRSMVLKNGFVDSFALSNESASALPLSMLRWKPRLAAASCTGL